MKRILFVLSTFVISNVNTGSSNAYAESSVCDSLSECIELQREVARAIKALSDDDLVRKTINGHRFTRDFSHPELGEAWKDERGTIWGETATKDGEPILMHQPQAAEYCNSIRARLPTNEEFVFLVEAFTHSVSRKRKETAYNPEILKDPFSRSWGANKFIIRGVDKAISCGGISGWILVQESEGRKNAVRCVARKQVR